MLRQKARKWVSNEAHIKIWHKIQVKISKLSKIHEIN